MISFGRGLCGKYAESSEREWLETNGLGGYAMGTVSNSNTRRYHGLLTVALHPPVDRFQAVNRLEESILVNGQRVEMSAQAYPGTVYPQGFRFLERFRVDPYPIWTFAAADARLERSFFLRYGENTAVVLYHLESGPECTLEVRPLLSGRSHHGIVKESAEGAALYDIAPTRVKMPGPGGNVFWLCADDGVFQPDSFWYRNQLYVWEERRGLEGREDVYSHGFFRFALKSGQTVALVMSTRELSSKDAPAWAESEKHLRARLLERSPVRGPMTDVLALAADAYLVGRGPGMSVIAGYPWFEDWSRDAMISLPGLTLATGRADDAEKILETYARSVKQGLLPNRFPDTGGPVEYNAADAPLWFVWAVQIFARATKNYERVRAWLGPLREIVDTFEKGGPEGLHMDRDGLIAVPEESAPLTWMDARVGGQAVTPRSGKPVEIQALWYNALQFLAELDIKFQQPSRGYEKLAAIARTSFNEKFWNEPEHYLFDRIEGKERDGSVRPNALLALSLPYEILEESRFAPVVEKAWKELYTSMGLRTLAARDPLFLGEYSGPPEKRDRAYHMGSVWSWFLGPFATAYVKAYGSSDETRQRLETFLQPVVEHLKEAGLGHVSELYDGSAPHAPKGCPAQAWSVAELLRVIWEENLVI